MQSTSSSEHVSVQFTVLIRQWVYHYTIHTDSLFDLTTSAFVLPSCSVLNATQMWKQCDIKIQLRTWNKICTTCNITTNHLSTAQAMSLINTIPDPNIFQPWWIILRRYLNKHNISEHTIRRNAIKWCSIQINNVYWTTGGVQLHLHKLKLH